jgi:cytochrome c oxidase subunit 2
MMELFRETASSFAGDIDFLIELVGWIVIPWLILAEGIFFYFMWKYRRKEGQPAQYVAGDKHAESKWVHWPHYAVIAFDIVVIVFAVKVWYHVKQELPPADETIRIVGQQWSWKFVHPGIDGELGTDDDVETIDELRVKNDTVYHFKLESKDVLHSFSVPVFRLKQDAIPGRVITGWFKPTKTGEFDIQCTEICGIGHGIMGARIIIEEPAQHTAWLKANQNQG